MGAAERRGIMRRLFVIVMTMALFLSVTAGIAGAASWEEKATGGMVATNYAGLTVDIAAFEEVGGGFRGQGSYYFNGKAYHVDASEVCINTVTGTVTIHGTAKVQSGTFGPWGSSPAIGVGDDAYGLLSLKDMGDGIVRARAGIRATQAELQSAINVQCGGSPIFPAVGPGDLNVKAK
jgi:hypothetical protein